ncbi:MAG: nucleoside hydrolase [Firmicutes bacterium]|nr:nucleoside hydrolase [Bacillota bacterium]
MKKILFDCDNTMGLPEKDVDDGLVLLYLIGNNNLKLSGVTTVFGNGSLEEVDNSTERIFSELNITDITLKSGACSSANLEQKAACYLVEQAKKYPGEFSLLATGALTNLKAAYRMDPEFFTNLKEIVVMGGLTEPLIFGDQEIEELNFSCDPEAAYITLNADTPVTVMSGNLCLEALFGSQEYDRLKNNNLPIYNLIFDYIKDWFDFSSKLIGKSGFYMWDLVAALYLEQKELYNSKYYRFNSDINDLTCGRLKIKELAICEDDKSSAGVINLPVGIKDVEVFKDLIFSTWANIKFGG